MIETVSGLTVINPVEEEREIVYVLEMKEVYRTSSVTHRAVQVSEYLRDCD